MSYWLLEYIIMDFQKDVNKLKFQPLLNQYISG